MDRLPLTLRTGSPLHGRGEGPYSQRLPPQRTYSSSSLVSDLSSHDIGDDASIGPSNRYSHTSGASGAQASTYEAPPSPALPSFPEDTSYTALVSPIESQGATPTFRRERSLLSTLGSIRSNRFSGRSRYGVLSGEDADHELSGKLRRRQLGGLDEEDEEPIGVDVSILESPIALRDLPKRPNIKVSEREGPWADGTTTTLGGGMNLVSKAKVVEPPSQHGHKRGSSMTDPETRRAAQQLAQSRGEILAVEAEPVVDISNFGGSDFSRRNTVASFATTASGDNEMQKSYYFPDDPEQPAWRPFSMRWPYITLLITTAVLLAALQEFLCQLSLQREKNGDGLIQFFKAQDIPTAVYFAWKYMPTIILVTYGVMWQVTDYEIKRLEPYYQLSRKGGAIAAHSLDLDYLTFMSYLIPFRAIGYKQWAVVFSSTATLVAGGLLAVLQSASVDMKQEPVQNGQPKKTVVVNPIWSRCLEAALAIIAILGILLLIQLRRKSGLLSDPKGIAGIAAMATKSHILNDFKGLDTAPNHIIHKQLKNRRYNLHKSSFWQGEYIRLEDKVEVKKVENPHPIMLRLEAGIPYILYMVAFLCMLPLVLFIRNASIVTLKVPFLLTAIAVSIKLLWGCLDINVRVIEPYYILSRRHAPPRTLTLDYTGTVPGYLSIKAMLSKHYLVALVGLGSILSEVLTVCATSFSVDGRTFIAGHANDSGSDGITRYDSGETFRSFWISFAIALSILIYLIANAALVYALRRHKFLPRQPGSISDVLAYIHQSRMLDDFVDTERFDGPTMNRHLEALGKTYALGWFNGRDGVDHCGVDQEPILAVYKHGFDWAQSRLVGNNIGTWEHF